MEARRSGGRIGDHGHQPRAESAWFEANRSALVSTVKIRSVINPDWPRQAPSPAPWQERVGVRASEKSCKFPNAQSLVRNPSGCGGGREIPSLQILASNIEYRRSASKLAELDQFDRLYAVDLLDILQHFF